MLIYNTTFHIEKSVLDKCVSYLKKEYIPAAVESGLLRSPRLHRILPSGNDTGSESYAVQFEAKSMVALRYWMMHHGAALHKEIAERFGQDVVGFSTLLEEIRWEED